MIRPRPFLGAILLAVLIGGLSQGFASRQAREPGTLTIRADGRILMTLSPAEIAKLKRYEIRVVGEGGTASTTFSGVRLWDVLMRADVPSDHALDSQLALMYLKLTGADGQGAVVALVEVDPRFSKRIALVADRQDGRPVDAGEGSRRVIIPDDILHARWIPGLVTIDVITVK
jgi:hypothetical protein